MYFISIDISAKLNFELFHECIIITRVMFNGSNILQGTLHLQLGILVFNITTIVH